jgi:hypothetical protein
VTENRYGRVRFDGVCTDTSNAALPVERVRRAVEPDFEPPWDDAAVHLALTVVHRGFVAEGGDGFELAEGVNDLPEEEVVARVCDEVRPRVDGGTSDAAAFVSFVRDVLVSLTEEV